MNIPTKYAEGTTHESYRCSKCGAQGVKLWRQYQTLASQVELMCLDCAAKDQNKQVRLDKSQERVFVFMGEPINDWVLGDSIGWLIPAIPTEEGDTYWGYTSVPPDGCKWWYALPVIA